MNNFNICINGTCHTSLYLNNESLKLTGILGESLFLQNNSHAHINGIVCNNINIDETSSVTINGMVNGTIYNYGKLEVYGTVKNIKNFGTLFISPNAKVDYSH